HRARRQPRIAAATIRFDLIAVLALGGQDHLAHELIDALAKRDDFVGIAEVHRACSFVSAVCLRPVWPAPSRLRRVDGPCAPLRLHRHSTRYLAARAHECPAGWPRAGTC